MTKLSVYKAGLMACIALIMIACATTDIRTHTDIAPGADLSAYKTFSWISERPQVKTGSENYINPIMAERLQSAIKNKFLAMGYTQVAINESPDFTLSYTVGSRDKLDVYSYPVYYRRDPWRWPYYYHDDVVVHQYTEGTLAIDVFDYTSGKPVWHGVAQRRITEARLDNPGPVIQETVDAILLKFPRR